MRLGRGIPVKIGNDDRHEKVTLHGLGGYQWVAAGESFVRQLGRFQTPSVAV